MAIARQLLDFFLLQPLHDLRRPPKGQVPALDFLRCCAVLGVIAFHFSRTAYVIAGGRENAFSRLPPIAYGRIGVELFFVLSGYLIGKQLWREMSRRGTLDLMRFLLRRGLRIWPLYYAVLAFAVARRSAMDGVSPGGLWANLFFLSNYFPKFDVVPGSWSLSVEEQFYLAAPLVLLCGVACRVPLRWYRWLLLALLAGLPLVRALVHWRLTGDLTTPVPEESMAHLLTAFHVRADGLVMGLLLAHQQVIAGTNSRWRMLASGWPPLLAGGVLVLVFDNTMFANTGCALFFGSCVWFFIARRGAGLTLLNARPFYVISRLSYGMYLTHFYLLAPAAGFTLMHLPGASRWPALNQMAGTLLLTAASAGVALGTFCLIEWPFLRLREWLFVTQPEPGPSAGGTLVPQVN